MALNKKYVVQKSFRIDANLEKDLEKLSEYLGRPQNELVNYSLELLMNDNKTWFAENMLVDWFTGYFDGGKQKSEYKDENVEITIIINKDCTTSYSFHVKNKEYKGERDYSGIYEDSDESMELIKDSLRRICKELIFTNDEEMESYCKDRLNYR